MKIVRNSCYGGFGLSDLALLYLSKITDKTIDQCEDDYWYGGYEIRAAPELVQTVEDLGEAASASYANLEVVEIPDDVKWTIENHDGIEVIEEVHRSW